MNKDALVPHIGVVTEIRKETPDVKTFRVLGKDGKKLFEHIPGQCAMLSLPGISEAIISITSSPTEEYLEFSIKKCGALTTALHAMEIGQNITIRGPFGNGFPVDTALKNKDLLFIAGGIGLAPLHSVINYCLAKHENYGNLNVIYGSRSKADLVDSKEILGEWKENPNIEVNLTIDHAEDAWKGHVGFVPNFVTELNPNLNQTVLICGPPIMIKFTLKALRDLGFKDDQVYTTLEMRMKCGIGKCGRCNIGDKYVCKDGPVFRFDELSELPDEY